MAGFENLIAELVSAPQYGPTKREQQLALDAERDYGLGETFQRGMQAGALGLSSDLDYFKALGNSLIGDEKAMARNLESARIGQQFASGALGNLEQFSEFIDEPTFEGFVSQVFKGTGQLAPFALTSVLGAGFGAGAALAGRGLAEGSRFAAKKIVRESLENVAKGTATPDQKDIAQATYSLAQDARRGALTGAFGAEFAPLSGQNFSEGIESGQDPNDPMTAFRALAVGAPQAAIGVGGEVALLKLIGNRAKKLSAGNEGTVMGRLARDLGTGFGRGGLVEAGTETVQEGLGVLNRAQMDDSFTAQEAKMRLGEAAFAAFFGGGAFGAAGSTVAGGFREINNIPDGVKDRARGMLEQGKEATVNFVSNAQAQMGMGGMTNPESSADLDAQVRAIYDDSSTKTAVWVEGDTPAYGANRPGGVKKVTIDGQEGYVAFIPGKGTIVAKTFDVAEEVVKGGATPAILAVALGYSAEKPSASDRVVQVTNSDGAVISEQATDEEGLPAALVAAQGLKPDGGNVEIKSPEDVLAERQAKVNAEAGPVVRDISVAPDGTISRSDRDVEAAAARARQDLADEDTEDFKAIEKRLIALTQTPELKGNKRLQKLKKEFRDGDIDRKREIVAALRAEQDLLARQQTDLAAETEVPLALADDAQIQANPQLDVAETAIEAEELAEVSSPISAINEINAPLLAQRRFKATSYPLFQALMGGAGAMKQIVGTDNARQNFNDQFPDLDTNWDSPYWAGMSEGMLKFLTATGKRGQLFEVDTADGSYDIRVYRPEGETFRHQPRGTQTKTDKDGKKRKIPKDEELLDLEAFLEAEVAQAQTSQFAKTSAFKVGFVGVSSVTTSSQSRSTAQQIAAVQRSQAYRGASAEQRRRIDAQLAQLADSAALSEGTAVQDLPAGTELKQVNLVDLTNAGRRLLETRLGQDFTAGSDGDALIEMLGELLNNGYQITFNDGRNDVPLSDRSATASGATLFDALAQYQQSVATWFLKNSQPDPANPTERNILPKSPPKPKAPPELKRLLKLRVGNEDKDTLQKALAGKLTRTTLAPDMVEENKRIQAERDADLEARARKQQGIGSGFEADEDVAEAVERQEAAEAGLIERPDFVGNESVDNPNPFQTDEDPPYAYYSVSKPLGRNRIYGNPISFPFGEPIALIAKPIMRAASMLKLKLPIGLVTVSQLQGLTQGQIADRFGDRTVAGAFIKGAADLRDRPDVMGRYVGFKNAHFIIVDDTKASNDYEAALTAAHELGHALFQEEFNAMIGKPIYDRMYKAFKRRSKSEAAYSGPHGFEEWFADNVAKWVDIQTRRDKNQRPANMEESLFNRIATRLTQMFKAFQKDLKRRFGGEIDVSVNAFIESVIRSNTYNNMTLAQDAAAVAKSFPTFEKKAMVRSIEVEIEKTKGADALAEKLKEFAVGSLKGLRKGARPLLRVLRTANKELRSISQPIAEMFYIEAQASGRGSRMGMLQEADVQNREFETKFERDVGFKIDSDEVAVAMDEAQSEVATDQLQNETAKKIRKFLQDIYTEYVEPRQAGYPDSQKIGFQENFFPVVLDMQAIANRSEAFKQLILNAPGQVGRQELPSDRRITSAINRLLKYQDVVQNQDLPVDQDLDPAAGREEERQLTADIDREVLADAGFLIPPVEAFKLYQRQLVRRIEWNKATKNERGQDFLTPLLNELSGEDKNYAREIINSYLGYGYEPMSERRRRIQSFLLASQYTILLPLAAIGSIPELAGPIINSKEFNGFEMAFRQIKDRTSLAEARELAEDIGLVQNDAIANGWISVSEREFMDTAARNWTDGFFKYTGLQWFTNFTRTFATGMGVQFLLRHAKNETNNPRSERYLVDLGVTAQEILAWENSGRDITTPEGRAVKFALQKFVESSILRPNAAERPSWASDPRWALVWQLKSYFYAFYTKIIGGIKREASTRLEEGEGGARVAGATAVLALSAVALLPLAMAGLELREYVKTAGAFVLSFGQSDKNYFRSDSMEWGSYLNEVVDRAGIYGPLSIWSMAYKTGQWNGPTAGLATLFGPTAESVEAALRGDADRLLPVAAVL